MSLFDTIGTYDNLDEPTPLLNHKSVTYGFIIAFLVRQDSAFYGAPSRALAVHSRTFLTFNFFSATDNHYDLCDPAIIRSLLGDSVPRMG